MLACLRHCNPVQSLFASNADCMMYAREGGRYIRTFAVNEHRCIHMRLFAHVYLMILTLTITKNVAAILPSGLGSGESLGRADGRL